MQQVVVITAYCTRLLHEKSSLNTVLDCQDQIRCSFAEKKKPKFVLRFFVLSCLALSGFCLLTHEGEAS